MWLRVLPRFTAFTLITLLLASCSGFGLFCTTETYTYTEQLPIYLSDAELEAVTTLPPQALEKPGKLYLHNNLLLINEAEKGIHIIDNSDPSEPKPLSFVSIPGNHDLLVKEDANNVVLYADNYMHLLSLDLGDPQNVTVLKRVKNVFQSYYPETNEQGQILVGYKEGDLKRESYRTCPGIGEPVADAPALPTNPSGPSQGGSLARFASIEDFLYTIDGSEIQSFRLEPLSDPQTYNRVTVDFGIETLFPYFGNQEPQLYIGGQSGMYIYDAADPSNLRRQGAIGHLQSCDPVVVQGDLAYVTLQGSCFNQQNRLEIIDVSDPSSPQLIEDYALQEPYGLGVDDNYLFVCDGQAGLKVYDNAREPENLELIKQFSEVKARDIIPYNGNAIVIAENGFYQYDYSALPDGDIELISSILVKENP